MLIFLLFSLLSFESHAIDAYCFNRSVNLKAAKAYVQEITNNSDRVYLRESQNCLEIESKTNKKDLFENWIGRKYRIIRTYSLDGSGSPSSGMRGGGHCNLSLERTMKEKSKTNEFSVGSKNRLRETVVSGSGKSVSSLMLSQGGSGTLQINDQRVELYCLRAGGRAHEVRVSLAANNSALSTVVTVNKGSKINLGSVVDNLSRKSKSVGVPSGVSKTKQVGSLKFDYHLLAK